MKSVNKVILLGNVTRDPELKATNGGQSVCTFGIATNRLWKDGEGQKQSLPEYHNIVAWSGLADFCGQYIQKGKPVYIEGYLKTRSWENEAGVKVFRTEVVLQDVVLLGPKGEQNASASYEDDDDSDIIAPDSHIPDVNMGYDDELPGGDMMANPL